jgi:WD40 repeat protein
VITVNSRQQLASGGNVGSVQLWDFQTGACVLTVPTHRPVLGVAQVAGSIAVGLDAGILVIKANLVA